MAWMIRKVGVHRWIFATKRVHVASAHCWSSPFGGLLIIVKFEALGYSVFNLLVLLNLCQSPRLYNITADWGRFTYFFDEPLHYLDCVGFTATTGYPVCDQLLSIPDIESHARLLPFLALPMDEIAGIIILVDPNAVMSGSRSRINPSMNPSLVLPGVPGTAWLASLAWFGLVMFVLRKSIYQRSSHNGSAARSSYSIQELGKKAHLFSTTYLSSIVRTSTVLPTAFSTCLFR